jgi:hypothetical protein
MPLICPNCATGIGITEVFELVQCPKCFTKLKAHIWKPVVAGIIIWVIIEETIAIVLYSYFGYGWAMSVLKTLIAAAIGIPVLFRLVKCYGAVEIIPRDRGVEPKVSDTPKQ